MNGGWPGLGGRSKDTTARGLVIVGRATARLVDAARRRDGPEGPGPGHVLDFHTVSFRFRAGPAVIGPIPIGRSALAHAPIRTHARLASRRPGRQGPAGHRPPDWPARCGR